MRYRTIKNEPSAVEKLKDHDKKTFISLLSIWSSKCKVKHQLALKQTIYFKNSFCNNLSVSFQHKNLDLTPCKYGYKHSTKTLRNKK